MRIPELDNPEFEPGREAFLADKTTRVYLAVFVSKENGVIGARAYGDETRCREAATVFEAALPGNYTRLYNEPIR